MAKADRPSPSETAETLESFEVAYARLESLVGRLESGDLGLDDALTSYEEGVRCLARCHKILNAAERKLELLVKQPDGELTTEPLDLDAMRQEARGEARIASSKESSPGRRAAGGPPKLARDSAPGPQKEPPAQPVLPSQVLLESGESSALEAERFYAEPEVLPAPPARQAEPKTRRRKSKSKSTDGGSASGERTLFGV